MVFFFGKLAGKDIGPLTVLVISGLLAAGCQSSAGKREAPKVAEAPPPTVQQAVAVPKAVKIQMPVKDQASFALARVVSGIRRGTTIANFPRRFLGICNASHGRKSTLDWATGRQEFGDWRSELGDIFFDVLRDKGVNVLGDPKKLFQRDDSATSAEYLVGARIQELNGRFCEAHSWLNRRPLDRYKGQFDIRIEWSVYSNLNKRTVARFETRGHFRQRKTKAQGILLTFLGAFADATENLLAEKAFVDLIERKTDRQATLASASGNFKPVPDDVGEFSKVEITRVPESRLAIRRIVADVTAAVVSIRAGASLGSGFLIDRSGLLMTNEHVVKQAKRVQVVFANGLEVGGKVVRRDPVHDVALVKIPLNARSVLPVRTEPAQRLEDVYAIGSPLMEALAATVTRGIVSAWRMEPRQGLRFIQADVPISRGNSGGPLLDQFGNVIGISVAGFDHDNAQNLNLFIPINDALVALNIVQQTAQN